VPTIQDALRDYFDAWNDAFQSKNDDRVRRCLSEEFKGYWGRSGLTAPETYDRTLDIQSVLSQYRQAQKSFEPISIVERGDGAEVVVFGTETNDIEGSRSRAKSMMVWRKEHREWKLLREYIELER